MFTADVIERVDDDLARAVLAWKAEKKMAPYVIGMRTTPSGWMHPRARVCRHACARVQARAHGRVRTLYNTQRSPR
jgi:hypothetical protein